VAIVEIILISQHYPSSFCSASAYIELPSSSPSYQTQLHASNEICRSWVVTFVFFILTAVFLNVYRTWLTILVLRHRRSHPKFFCTGETPAPFTWNLPLVPSPSEHQVNDNASIASSSMLDDKKSGAIEASHVSTLAYMPPYAPKAECATHMC